MTEPARPPADEPAGPPDRRLRRSEPSDGRDPVRAASRTRCHRPAAPRCRRPSRSERSGHDRRPTPQPPGSGAPTSTGRHGGRPISGPDAPPGWGPPPAGAGGAVRLGSALVRAGVPAGGVRRRPGRCASRLGRTRAAVRGPARRRVGSGRAGAAGAGSGGMAAGVRCRRPPTTNAGRRSGWRRFRVRRSASCTWTWRRSPPGWPSGRWWPGIGVAPGLAAGDLLRGGLQERRRGLGLRGVRRARRAGRRGGDRHRAARPAADPAADRAPAVRFTGRGLAMAGISCGAAGALLSLLGLGLALLLALT